MANNCYTYAIIENCNKEKLSTLIDSVENINKKLHEKKLISAKEDPMRAVALAIGLTDSFLDGYYTFSDGEVIKTEVKPEVSLRGYFLDHEFCETNQAFIFSIESAWTPLTDFMDLVEEYLEGNLSYIAEEPGNGIFEKHGTYYPENFLVDMCIEDEYVREGCETLRDIVEYICSEIKDDSVYLPYRKILESTEIKELADLDPIIMKMDEILSDIGDGYISVNEYEKV